MLLRVVRVPVLVRGTDEQWALVATLTPQIIALARVESVSALKGEGRPGLSAAAIVDGAEVFVPLEGLIDVAEERARLVREADKLLSDLEGSSRIKLSRAPFETRSDEPIVQLVGRLAGTPDVVGVGFWADSALLAAAGIPTVVFGPRGEGEHGAVEWVDLASVERCADLYLAVAKSFCA